jgi:predicted MFS family arabinose efflux permease
MSETSALRRFLVLTALRWLPSGLMIPIYVLLPLQRGLSLSQVGLALAAQGVVVMMLELPTGGLADALGRRRVLLTAMVFGIASTALFLVAHSFPMLAAACALTGVYRALDSGPLEAWYVDAAHAANPDARIDRGMGAQGTVAGVAIAVGALGSGALAAWHPLPTVDPLALAVTCSLVLHLVNLLVTAVLMVEQPRHGGRGGVLQSVREAPRTIVEGIGLLRASRVLLALVCVELFWGFGMVTFEGLFPVRLAELLGGTEQAAVITGPAASAAWIASAAGSALTPWLGRRLGMARAAALTRIAQGLAVAAMGLFAGVTGVVVAFLACYAVHGTSGAAHSTLLHEQATAKVRATVLSLNSMFSQPAGALGGIALTALADGTSVSIAIIAGAVVLAAAAPLYLPAARRSVRSQEAPAPATVA